MMTTAEGRSLLNSGAAEAREISGDWTFAGETIFDSGDVGSPALPIKVTKIRNWWDTQARYQGDGREQLVELTHDGEDGYVFHVNTGANAGAGATCFGIGINPRGTGIILRNYVEGVGLRVSQLDTITSANAFGIRGSQASIAPWMKVTLEAVNAAQLAIFEATMASTAEALVVMSSTVAGAPAPLRLNFSNATAGDKILKIENSLGTVAHVEADTGKLVWNKGGAQFATGQDVEAIATSRFIARGSTGAATPRIALGTASSEAAMTTWRATGSGTTHWAFRWITSNDHLRLEGAASAEIGAESWSKVLEFRRDRIGFFGTTAVAKPTGVAVTAEGIHAALVTLGLIAA